VSETDVPTRAELPGARRERLSEGGPRNPDVWRIEWRGTPMVVKDFSPRGALVRATLGRFITSREARAWRLLDEHVSAVPRFYGQIDELAFAVEYRPGPYLSRATEVNAEFVPRLERAVREMHACGIVHLDLKHRDNVLRGVDGRPVLIDFGSALVFKPGGWIAKLLMPALAAIDRSAVRKWTRKLAPSQSA
jgi:serine/threonine protein kinase